MADPDFGTDIDALLDIPKTFALVSGRYNLARALMRRLSTPRGFLADAFGDDPDYGLDVRSYLNRGFTQPQISAIESEIKDEVEKDERVQSADVTAKFSRAGSSLSVEIQVDTAAGPFTLVMAISSLTVQLLSVGEPSVAPVAAAAAAPTTVITVQGSQGPAGPSGSPGASGTGTVLEVPDPTHYASSSGGEELVMESLEDFDLLAAGTLAVEITAQVRAAGGATGTFRVYVGGTDGAVGGGTLVATITSTSATFESKRATGSFANPLGLKLVKLTLQSSVAGQDAAIKGTQISFK